MAATNFVRAGGAGKRTLGVEKAVATSDYSYDSLGRLTGIDHHQGDTVLADYAYSYEDDMPVVSGQLSVVTPGNGQLTTGPIRPAFILALRRTPALPRPQQHQPGDAGSGHSGRGPDRQRNLRRRHGELLLRSQRPTHRRRPTPGLGAPGADHWRW